jgi:acyl carrier protein phosphodiesterase
MNFLAHIYLSGENDLIKIGNFMADGIHGKHFEAFPLDIQKGIVLHRSIDTFTDTHPVFKKSTKRLHPNYHHYSGIIVDIFYDHFLAKNWNHYSDENLENFVERFYQSLNDHYDDLTPKTQKFMSYMIDQNWLVSYKTIEGIEGILTQMDRRMTTRMKQESNMQFSVSELRTYYSEFEIEFTTFFNELIAHSHNKLLSL